VPNGYVDKASLGACRRVYERERERERGGGGKAVQSLIPLVLFRYFGLFPLGFARLACLRARALARSRADTSASSGRVARARGLPGWEWIQAGSAEFTWADCEHAFPRRDQSAARVTEIVSHAGIDASGGCSVNDFTARTRARGM